MNSRHTFSRSESWTLLVVPVLATLIGIQAWPPLRAADAPISGIYPHLAMWNYEGECGTGAVVPWADRLWVVTYGPHLPNGSRDKLYEITPELEQIIRPESIGGTPANRMVHRETNQLVIGPYVIGDDRDGPGDSLRGDARATDRERSSFDRARSKDLSCNDGGGAVRSGPALAGSPRDLRRWQRQGIHEAQLCGEGSSRLSRQGSLFRIRPGVVREQRRTRRASAAQSHDSVRRIGFLAARRFGVDTRPPESVHRDHWSGRNLRERSSEQRSNLDARLG